jgi:DHA2 family integral membrane protein (MFS transporter)
VDAARAGRASGTNSAIRQIGASFGIAVMGGIGQIVFSSKLDDSSAYKQLPESAQSTADESVTGAVEVGQQVGGKGGQALIDAANSSFTTGLHWAVGFAAVVAVIGAILAVALIPARVERSEAEPGGV